MMIREAVVAGQFYPGRTERCRSELTALLHENASVDRGNRRALGGLVPHAGWAFSGRVAAEVFRAVAGTRSPEVVILFGGVHRHRGNRAALFGAGRWSTPMGSVVIDARLAERIMGHTNLIVDDPYAHEDEHSIEVQLPFLQHLFPDAKVVPIMVPPIAEAHEVGDAVSRTIRAYDYDAVIVGTTDLTHYGPRYGFVPHGIGAEANAWAKSVNDRRFIDLVCALKSEELVKEALEHKNACSSGAAAAAVSAATGLGATRAALLEHTTSSEVLDNTGRADHTDSVGYAGVLFSE